MITAHFFYDDSSDCLELARVLTEWQHERPGSVFTFCTHDIENAIGILQSNPDDVLTPEAIDHAWRIQSSQWIDTEEEDFNLDAWIDGWALLAPQKEAVQP